MILRHIVDWVKDGAICLDGCFLDAVGHPVVFTGSVLERKDYTTNKERRYAMTMAYGTYELPTNTTQQIFGIDIEFNIQSLNRKLGRMPAIAEILFFEDSNWVIINKAYKHDRYLGKYRLILHCAMYHESTTNGETVCKNGDNE